MISSLDIIMRTIIDIPDDQVAQLADVGRRRGVSRAALVREAIGAYLERHGGKARESAFGLWGKGAPDGLAYQRKLRAEW
jgi:hypothetical protein